MKGNGKIRIEFIRYVLPSMLAFALSGIYSIADGFFVGNELGDDALTAINVAYPLTAFIQAAGTGIGMGGAILFTLSANSAKPEMRRQYFAMSLILLPLFGFALTAFVYLIAPFVLHLFGAEGTIFALAENYIRFIAFGAVFQVLGTGLTPFIRNMGGTVTAMSAMIAGFVTNIVLDYVFVWIVPWGMAGAAIATVIGQAATFLVCFGYLIVKKQRPDFKFGSNAAHIAGRTLRLGLSPFGLAFAPNFMLIFVNRSASAVGGEFSMNCFAPVAYAISVVLLLVQGVSDGCQPLVSQEFGKGNIRTAKSVRKMSVLFSLVVVAVCTVALFFLRNSISKVFGASDAVSAEVGNILPLFMVGFPFIGFSRIATAFFYATENTWRAYIVIYGEPLCLLVLLLALPGFMGIAGTWLAVSLSQALTAAVAFLLVLLYDRRQRKSGGTAPAENRTEG